jgi:hypothetical protein
MNNKLIHLIPIFLYFIIGCNSPNESPSEVQQYCPMGIGSYWEYSKDGASMVEKIIDTLTINKKLFFGFTRGSEVPDYWLSESNGKIYYLNLKDSVEFLLFDFTSSIGNSWDLPSGYECSFGRGITFIGNTDTIVTSIGTFYDCYHFKHQKACNDAGIYDSWYVKGIGKVKYNVDNFSGNQKYVINNYKIVASTYP